MKFHNLALTGWSYEKADKEIPMALLAEQGLPRSIQSRNPVPGTWVYSDDSQWRERLSDHVNQAVAMSGIAAEDIQGFMGVHNGYKLHPEPAGPAVMGALKQTNKTMFDINLGCASVILAAQLAGLHFSDENVHNVAVGMVQLNTQYTTLCTDGNCILCDSTGALLFSKTTTGNLIRLTQINGDPNFSDMFVIGDDSKYSLQNLHKGRDLNKYMIKAFGDQVMNGCKALKTFPKEIDFIAISCSTYQASKMVLEALNFPVERSGLECLTKVPHMGTNDLIYQIEYGIEQGMIKKGSKILVSGTSLGFSIGTMAIEWGVT